MKISMLRKMRFRIAAILILSLICVTAFITIAAVLLRPRIILITQNYAKNEVSRVVDRQVQKVMLEKFFSYDEITHITRDNSGRVTSVTSNSTLINRFTNNLDIAIGNELEKNAAITNKIHLSSLLGSEFFAGTGPKIPIRFSPVSVTSTYVTHSFEEAGINQTLHTINLSVKVDMAIIMPFAHSVVKVTSRMPIAQTLIVGVVPDGYFYKK